jgi:predicted ATP-grasp superfamily ATP-dependent carboligase
MSNAAEGPGVSPARRRPTVLLVTFSPDYPAPARMPRELQRAGLEVVLLAPRGALCTKTGFIDRVQHMPEEQSILEWIDTLVELVRATGARMLLPGDDVTVQAFMQITHETLPALRPGVQAELAALIRSSLGDPAGYLDSINKGRLARRAQRLGLPVPPGESVADAEAAVRAAAAIGYPVMVRPTFGWASRGVRECANAADVRAAMADLPQLATWVPTDAHRALVQRVIRGRPVNRAALAWEGREVAGFCRSRLRPPPEVPHAGTVSRYLVLPEVTALNRRLLAELGASGFVATEYRIEADTGTPYLIEINRRMVPATHTGSWVGVDLAAALAAILESQEWTGAADLAPANERTLALFPQEWLRDPSSADLVELPSDAPWDDPALFQAMLQLRGARR